jgi:hypothetical protein
MRSCTSDVAVDRDYCAENAIINSKDFAWLNFTMLCGDRVGSIHSLYPGVKILQ